MGRRFQECCCGINVRTGAVVAGWFTGIGGYFGLATFSVAAEYSTKTMALHVLLILLSCKCAMEMIASIVLVYGASAEKRSLVMPWMCSNVFSLVVGTGLHIAVVCVLYPSQVSNLLLYVCPFYALGQALLLPVVYNLYTELATDGAGGSAEGVEKALAAAQVKM